MASKFSFENAAFHFAKTDGAKGFLLPYLVSYVVLGALLYALMTYLLWPVFEVYGEMFSLAGAGASEREIEAFMSDRFLEAFGSIWLGAIGAFLLYMIFYVSMEAAIQRRYIHDEGFSLRFGGDELRLILVFLVYGLMFFAISIGAMIILGIFGFILAQLGEGALLVLPVLGIFAVYGSLLYFSIKFAPAAALTIRDREFRFFGAWNVTKNRWWAMFGSYIVLYLILAVAFMIFYFILIFALVGTFMGAGGAELGSDPEAAEVFALLAQPVFLIVSLLAGSLFLAYGAFSQYAWAGIAAIAAKDDPKVGGGSNPASAFD